jgi:hypothetical protein
MDPIFACFVGGVLIVFFLTLSTVVFNYACNLIEEHGLILLFETVYEHSLCKTLLCLGFWRLSTLNALKPFGAKSNNYNEHT